MHVFIPGSSFSVKQLPTPSSSLPAQANAKLNFVSSLKTCCNTHLHFFNNNMQQIFITQLLGLSAFSNTNWFFVCFWYDTSFTHTHTQTHTSICKYVHACTPTLPDMPICVCMYVHVCMCTHTHTHTHTLSVCLSVSLSLCDKIPTSPPVFLKQRN